MQQRGSVGTIRTQTVDLPEPLRLDSGKTLAPVRIAYETYGTLAPARDNVVLVCHALSGDAHAAGWSDDPTAPTTVDGVGAAERGKRGLGWWDGMIGPGKAFDTERYFVVCSNLIGSCRGSTGPASTDPATGKPYGAADGRGAVRARGRVAALRARAARLRGGVVPALPGRGVRGAVRRECVPLQLARAHVLRPSADVRPGLARARARPRARGDAPAV